MPQDYTITFLTRYEDFEGDFVQHCHILDHEDQGMMERVRIAHASSALPRRVAIAAIDAPVKSVLTNRDGKPTSLDSFRGRPVVLILSKGTRCTECLRQLETFAAAIHQHGYQVIAITPDAPAALEHLPKGAFVPLSDVNLQVFKGLGCYDGPARQTRHGTFLLSSDGTVIWKNVQDVPFMDSAVVLIVSDAGSDIAFRAEAAAALRSRMFR